MALSQRYSPSWPPGEAAWIGLDFADVLPPGVVLISASLTLLINRNPVAPQSDFTQGPVTLDGRQAWCEIAGGAEGVDYQARWTVTDNRDHTWNRTALLLCAETS
jgi:hypothetical protein